LPGRLTHARALTPEGEARVTATVRRHGALLDRIALQLSLCADDAQDAVQRALEIYLRRVDTLDAATELGWLVVVVRNEALAVRRARVAGLGDGDDPEAAPAVDAGALDEHAERREQVGRSREILARLKDDEARALLLKAGGHSYAEIGRATGWSHTKTNRLLTEGRARFRRLYGGLEAGERCAELAPVLAALGQGGVDAEDLIALRPHLRHCAACRAEVRRLHGTRLGRAAAALLLPFPAVVERLRSELYGIAARLHGSADPVAAGAGAGAGGGRGFGAAAVVAACLGGIGAGGYCVIAGDLPGPLRLNAAREVAAATPARSALANPPLAGAALAASATAQAAATAGPATTAAAKATPTATATAAARAKRSSRTRSSGARRSSTDFSFETASPARASASPRPRVLAHAASTRSSPTSPSATPRRATADSTFGFER
jgi:DNA-directed RNA polymerase specialized sigma24 family protein